MTSGVYELWFGPYFYHGSSKNIERRWKEHRKALENGKHCNPKVQAAFDKHGWTDAQVLVECDVDHLIAWEQAHLDTHFGIDPKYLNLSPTAGHPGHTMEAREKMRRRAESRWTTDEYKSKMKTANNAYWAQPGTRQAASARQKEVVARPGQREKLSAAGKAYFNDTEALLRHGELMKQVQNRSEVRSKKIATLKAYFSDPENRAKNSSVQKDRWTDDLRAEQGRRAKAQFASPEARAKASAASKAAWARRKAAKRQAELADIPEDGDTISMFEVKHEEA